MILSDADILRRLEAGDLVVEPLEDPDIQVQPASVDLRLGREFLEFQHANIPCIHPNSEQEVADYVSETVVPQDGEYILHPGDFVLGTTKERVRIPDDLIAHVEGRSSLGRLAIVVHASLPYDEQVFLWTPEDGFGFHEIGEVVENQREARAVAFDPKTLRVSTHRVTNYITNPTKRIYRIRLETGREVLVTRDHNLFTLDARGGVTRIPSEDAEGTLVMVPDTLPPSPTTQEEIDLLDVVDPEDTTLYASDGFGSVAWSRVPDAFGRRHENRDAAPMAAVPRGDIPTSVEVAFKQGETHLPRRLQLTPAFGWVLGFYIVGGTNRRDRIQIDAANEEYLDRFAEFFRRYGTSLSWSDEEHTGDLTVCSALWSKVFSELAGDGDTKNLPDVAWNWPEEVLEALLHGLFDGDGRRRGTRTTLQTETPALANRAAYLGTRLGYRTSISGPQREPRDPTSGCKTAGEEWTVEFREGAHEQEQEVPVPNELLRDYRETAGMSRRTAADAMGYASSRIANVEAARYDGIKRDTLVRFSETYADSGVDTDRLDRVLDAGVRFERVAAVEETDRVEPTYDLEVQPNGRLIENFLGGRGGVFLSNTAGLCDPGYEGQITLELSNLGRAPVALTPGMRISQLTFTELKTPAERPYGEDRGSKYQGQSGPQASRIQGDREFGGEQ